MPITDSYTRLRLDEIFVPRDERQRKQVSTKGLIESIRVRGVLQPIIVERHAAPDGRHKLTAGERRYTASLELGLATIPVRFAEDLDPIESSIFELEENIKRADLPWQDLVRATEAIHQLYKSATPTWTQDETTEALGLTKGTVSIYLRVAAEIAKTPKLAEASSVREVYNQIVRRDSRHQAEAMEAIFLPIGTPAPVMVEPLHETLDGTPVEAPAKGGSTTRPATIINPSSSILQESFLFWAPKYTGKPFNFIHCDFPYGINVFEGPQAGASRHTAYSDSADIHTRLLETLLTNLDRVASGSCHIMYWYSNQHYDLIRRMVQELAPDLSIHVHPLIWVKSDGSGIASDPRRFPRHVYETCLLMSRGGRQIVRIVADAYSAPPDRDLHVHAKPEPMLRHFMTMLVDENTTMLDPTCGGASSLRAAESLGANYVLGMDVDETIVGNARTALRHFRVLRAAARHPGVAAQ
jgi:ParB/RepB/Spo0J family partition protein